MAEYIVGQPGSARRIGVLPSAFNPPTIAHLTLAASAQQHAGLDQIVLALPRSLPHKSFDGASLEQRMAMVSAAAQHDLSLAAALTDGGLFVEIAREFRLLQPNAEIFLICGKDAAERIVGWDYGDGPAFDDQLHEFTLLVGDRDGRYHPPGKHADRIIPAPLPPNLDLISSQALRERRERDEDWRALTLPSVAQLIEDWGLYRRCR